MKKLIPLFILLFAFSVFGQSTLTGKVVRVIDGDTIVVLDSQNRQIVVRLAGIDAPESRQEFGEKAKYNLANLVFGKTVKVSYSKTDRYNRIVGQISLGETDVNFQQISDCFAWHYKEYEKEQIESDRTKYANAEIVCKKNERGLWRQAALPPWEWRAKKSAGGSESPTPPSPEIQNAVNQSAEAQESNGGSSASPPSGNKTVRVKGYTRKNGTYVAPHTRSAPRRKN